MSLFQKWALGLLWLGAGALVFAKPDAFYKVASGVRNITAGSVTDIVNAGKK
jgi:hypothetical protein